MKGYIVFTREKTLDAAELAIYWDKIHATFEGHEVKVLAAYGKKEVLEDETEGIVITEFPTFGAPRPGTTVPHIARCASTAKEAPSIAAF